MRRGQISAIDVGVAITLFASIYVLLFPVLSGVSIEQDEFDTLSLKSSAAASYLLSSSGEPFNWTPSSVRQLGLVVEQGVIENEKLGSFLNLSQTDFNKTRDLLGISGYKFFFNASHLNGSTLQVNSANFNGTALIGSDFDSQLVVSTRRVAVYNSAPILVQFKIGT